MIAYPDAPKSILWPATGERITKLPLRVVTDHQRGATLPDVAQYMAPCGAAVCTRAGHLQIERDGWLTKWHSTLGAAVEEMSEVLP